MWLWCCYRELQSRPAAGFHARSQLSLRLETNRVVFSRNSLLSTGNVSAVTKRHEDKASSVSSAFGRL